MIFFVIFGYVLAKYAYIDSKAASTIAMITRSERNPKYGYGNTSFGYTCYYEFSVNGRIHTGAVQSFYKRQNGEPVAVTYRRGNPDSNYPTTDSTRGSVLVLRITFFVVLVIGAVGVWIKSRR